MLQGTLKDGGVLSCHFESFSSLFRNMWSVRSFEDIKAMFPCSLLSAVQPSQCGVQFSSLCNQIVPMTGPIGNM